MATLTEIINKSSKKQEKQIARLVEVVASARADYGNEGVEIEAPTVNTCEGGVKFQSLSAGDKLALVNGEIRCIQKDIGEIEYFLEGKISKKTLQKVINEAQAAYIANNPILTNLGATSKSKYL